MATDREPTAAASAGTPYRTTKASPPEDCERKVPSEEEERAPLLPVSDENDGADNARALSPATDDGPVEPAPPAVRAAAPPPPSDGNLLLRAAYLSALSAIFLSAVISYYVQYPGLLSSSGIDPADRILPRAFPEIQRRVVDGGWMDSDTLAEVTCVAGVFAACLGASGLLQHGLLFLLLTILYYFLVVLGGTFYTFQWDLLLLECAFVSAVCVAPWGRLNLLPRLRPSSRGERADAVTGAALGAAERNGVGLWPLRFLLFKLMFMSGVVKIQADCPTWLGLTALEYHMATQCLPGPLAWHAHQLHPFFLRLSVAATFVIEIPAPFLLISPWATVRRFGAALQILLQVMIILTGNYTFFNWLTIVLCLPCIEGGDSKVTKRAELSGAGQKKRKFGWAEWQLVLCAIFLWWSSSKMFRLDSIEEARSSIRRLNVVLTMSKDDCDRLIEETVPYTVPATLLFLLWTGLRSIPRRRRKLHLLIVFVQVLVSSACVGMASIPLLSLTPKTDYPGSRYFVPMWQAARAYRLFGGYGLFRRMTGVGRVPQMNATEKTHWGWAGLPPSVVARPEIILEGRFREGNSTSREWNELKFRWKPGDVTERPKQVAPHQPRLDWRMWFAALGQYQGNPWLLNLVSKLLKGCPPVLNLLDEPELEAGTKKLSHVRAMLWDYDFTRIDSEWSRRIPNAENLVGGETRKTTVESLGDYEEESSVWNRFWIWPSQYWTRSFVRQYLPSIAADNQHPSVVQFLAAHGYGERKCLRAEERCNEHVQKNPYSRFFCGLATSIRMRNLIWAPVVWLVLWLFVCVKISCGEVQASTKCCEARDGEPTAEMKKNQ